MSKLAEKVEKIIREQAKKEDDSIKKFNQSMSALEKLGLIKKPGYSFPMKDTIGMTLYEKMNAAKQ